MQPAETHICRFCVPCIWHFLWFVNCWILYCHLLSISNIFFLCPCCKTSHINPSASVVCQFYAPCFLHQSFLPLSGSGFVCSILTSILCALFWAGNESQVCLLVHSTCIELSGRCGRWEMHTRASCSKDPNGFHQASHMFSVMLQRSCTILGHTIPLSYEIYTNDNALMTNNVPIQHFARAISVCGTFDYFQCTTPHQKLNRKK